MQNTLYPQSGLLHKKNCIVPSNPCGPYAQPVETASFRPSLDGEQNTVETVSETRRRGRRDEVRRNRFPRRGRGGALDESAKRSALGGLPRRPREERTWSFWAKRMEEMEAARPVGCNSGGIFSGLGSVKV